MKLSKQQYEALSPQEKQQFVATATPQQLKEITSSQSISQQSPVVKPIYPARIIRIFEFKPATVLLGGFAAMFIGLAFVGDEMEGLGAFALIFLIFAIFCSFTKHCSNCRQETKEPHEVCLNCWMDLRQGNQNTQKLGYMQALLLSDWKIISDGESGVQMESVRKMRTSSKIVLIIGILLVPAFGIGLFIILAVLIEYFTTKVQRTFIPKAKS